MRALIADDEPHLALYLRDQIALLWPELEIVHMSRNGIDAAQRIRELEPDLAFLDIQMPGLTGLEVAQGIEGSTRVVFVTAYDEFALAAFDQAALDYVLKPLKTERLARTLERIKSSCAPQPRLRHIRASQGDVMHQIAVADVLFFQAGDKYTMVKTTGAEHLIRTPISELANQLEPDRFWQIHRATLINVDHLDGTRRDEASRLYVRVKGYAGELPVSRPFVHMFRAM
jgi:DNA-binding LytR/AlgR family response regulator